MANLLKWIVVSTAIIFINLSPGHGQELSQLRRSTEQYCVVCHVSWSIGADSTTTLIPRIEPDVLVDGKPSHVAREEICFSCHDGYVSDSRDFFLENDKHKLKPDIQNITHGKLPLDLQGKMYCGTCHSPHSSLMVEKTIYKPFLREKIDQSQLCLNCHKQLAVKGTNHPIHVKMTVFPEKLKHKKLAREQVECLTCHVMHHKNQYRLVKIQDRTTLCYQCHESYFGILYSDHDLRFYNISRESAYYLPERGKDVCYSCHLTHKGKSNYMWVKYPGKGENAYCLDCHSSHGLAKKKHLPAGGHPVDTKIINQNIPLLNITSGDTLSCKSCHNPHQWEKAGGKALTPLNEEGTELTSFLKLPDDQQGSLCINCHQDKKSILVSDHAVVRKGFQDYFRKEKLSHGQCSVCHFTHKKGYRAQETLQLSDPVAENCLFCHSNKNYLTSIGKKGHPLHISFKATKPLKGLDKNGETLLSCNTCHDPHRWGMVDQVSVTADLEGNNYNSFLVLKNSPIPELCFNCHPEKKEILATDHDIRDQKSNICNTCHTPHNAITTYGIFVRWKENNGQSFNEHLCFNCHSKGKLAEKKIPEAYRHPHKYGVVALNLRGTGKWNDFPLFTEKGPSRTVGFIDCFTCHDPHKWSYDPERQPLDSSNEEGDYFSSFLRNPSYKTLCNDCHGAAAIWKFTYYHDPVKRKRY